jgi:hypothetical protein
MIALDQAAVVIGAEQLHQDTHRVAILHTIIKDTHHQGQAALEVISTVTEVQMVALV